MKTLIKFSAISILAIGIIGCGGSEEPVETKIEDPEKNLAYYTQELDKSTSIRSLYTDETVLLSMNSLEKTLNQVSDDINKSSIAEIMYQLQYSLQKQVSNVDNFTFNKETAIILDKSSGLRSESTEVGLIDELDKASRKIIAKDISLSLPENFFELLNANEDIDEDNSTQSYLSFAPNIPNDIACPPAGVCRENSPMDRWQKGGLAEVQKFRAEYKIELEEVIDGTNSDTRANIPTRTIENMRTWSCPSDGYSIKAINFTNGTSELNFTSHSYRTYLAHSIVSFQPFGLNERYLSHEAQGAAQSSVCLTDGSWVPGGDSYYSIKKDNNEAWYATSAHWEGASNLPGLADIDNAAQALSTFGFKLSRVANGPLPSGCSTLACTISAGAGPDYSDGIDPAGRVSMVDVAMSNPELSGQDIFNLFRGDAWGTHREDVQGISLNWAITLDNLGIMNGAVILQNMREQFNNSREGTFIFRKIESDVHFTMDLMPIDDDYNELIIIPRTARTESGSFPTNLYMDVPPTRTIPPFGRPNPNYCAEIDPSSDSYIPVYLVDSNVLLELTMEVEYLTESQLDRIEADKNINIWEQYFEQQKSDDDFGYGSDPSVSYPMLIEYNCHETEEYTKEGDKPIVECDTKNKAYYDALIDRLIILNPTLNGSQTNHPCLGGVVLNPWISVIQTASSI